MPANIIIESDKKSELYTYIIIVVTFIVASMINVYPLSANLAVFRPMALIMVLIFWLIFQPTLVGVGIAFFIGLISDFLLDSQLGQQALSAVIVAFFIKMVGVYLKQFSLITAWLLAGVCLFLYQSCLIILHLIIHGAFVPELMLAVLTSFLTWPLLQFVLIRYVRKT